MSHTVKLWSVLLSVVILLNVLTALLAILPNALAALLASRESVEAFVELGSGNIVSRVASVVDSLEFSVVFVQRAKNFSTTPGLDSSVNNILTWLGPAVANAGAAVGCYCLNNGTSIVVYGNTNQTGTEVLDVWVSGSGDQNETYRAQYNVTSSFLARSPDASVPYQNCTSLEWNTRFSTTSGTHWSSDLPSLAVLGQSEPAIVTGGPLFQSALVPTVLGTVSYVYTGLQELLNSFEILSATVQIFVYPDNGTHGTVYDVAGNRILVASVNPTPKHVGVPLRPPLCPNGTLPCLIDEGTAFSYSAYIRANTSSAVYATRSDTLLLTFYAAKTMFIPSFASAVVICVVCSVIAIVVFSGIAGYVLSRSLDLLYKLEWHLQAISLLTSDAPAVTSRGGVLFHEVDRILTAYESMHEELQKMKAHLPQSVLAQLQREMAEEDSLGSSENDLKSISVDQQLAEIVDDGGMNPLVSEQLRSVPMSVAPLPREDARRAEDDTHSQTDSQISFTMQRVRREGRPTLRSLKDLCVVSAKKVTVVMANTVGFHRIMESRGAAQAEALHTTILETLLRVVNQTSGVIDFCHGDRFLISFNASTSCLNHSVCAAEATLRVTQHLSSAAPPDYQGIRFGISSSEALCGVFGNDVLKRFSIIGSVVNHAFTLMQQSRAEETFGCGRILMCSTVFARTRARYVAEHVNYVLLPGNARPGLISCLRSVRPDAPPFELVSRRLRAKSTKGTRNQPNETISESDEALQRMYDSTNVDAINRAFECFAGGDVAGAQALAVSIPDSQGYALRKALRVCS